MGKWELPKTRLPDNLLPSRYRRDGLKQQVPFTAPLRVMFSAPDNQIKWRNFTTTSFIQRHINQVISLRTAPGRLENLQLTHKRGMSLYYK